jgi:hypothetical protein
MKMTWGIIDAGACAGARAHARTERERERAHSQGLKTGDLQDGICDLPVCTVVPFFIK